MTNNGKKPYKKARDENTIWSLRLVNRAQYYNNLRFRGTAPSKSVWFGYLLFYKYIYSNLFWESHLNDEQTQICEQDNNQWT